MKYAFRNIPFALFACAVLAGPVTAQTFPERPVRVVVPFPPGGSVDVTGRLVAQQLSEQLKEQFIVENRSGAGGNVGSDTVAKSAPDGHTLLHTAPGPLVINQHLYANMPYDPQKDLKAVALVAVTPIVLMVNPKLPIKNVQDLIDYAKKNPGKVSYGSAGVGSTPHLAGELFQNMAGVELVHVPYKGTAPAMNDLVGGHIQIFFDLLPSSLPQIKAGRVRAIANAGLERPKSLSDLPTLSEQGLKGFSAASWVAIAAPAKTPDPVIAKLREEIGKALKSKLVLERLADLGSMAGTADAAELETFMTTEADKWAKVIKQAGIEPK